MNLALLLDDVHLSLNDREILNGVSLSVKKGETITIMGPNGAGKTTLLKVAMGLLKPTKGSISLFFNGKAKRRGLIGYIPQNLGLVNNLDVISNIIVGALYRMPKIASIVGFYPRDVLDDAYSLMNRLGIDGLARVKISRLSGGEKQKVAIARALLQRPSIIFADEMASNLDLKASHEVMKSLLEMKREMGLTLVMTHHNPDFAKRYSDIIYLMRDGRIVNSIQASSFDSEKLLEAYERA